MKRLAPVAWLALALPVATLVAGFLTLRIAARDDGTSAWGGVRRTAQVQTEDLAPDRAAAARNLSARLGLREGLVEVEASGIDVPTLALRLVHPLHADRDVDVALARRGARWQGTLPPGAPGRRYLRLEGPDWRLVGELAAGAQHADLRPAVAATGAR